MILYQIKRVRKLGFFRTFNFILKKLFNIYIKKEFPREAVNFAKNHFKDKKVIAVEIGVYRGENSKSILKTLNINKIYLIDPYQKYKDYEKGDFYEIIEKTKRIAIEKLDEFNNKIEWIFDYSHEAIKKIKSRVDFIYIDGNHEYKYVKQDLEDYWRILNKDGIISGHDIDGSGVIKAVLEFCMEKGVELHIEGRDFYMIKN